MYTFVLSRYLRAVMPDLKGNFYFCPHNTRRYPYRSEPKGAQSPEIGLDTVKGNAVFCYPFLNLSKMSKTISGATAPPLAISAEKIIKDLVSTDETSRMRQHLRDMLDSYLLSEDEASFRKEIYGTYLALDSLLVKSEERRAL